MESISQWQPLPEGTDQLPLDYIKKHKVLILLLNDEKIVLGTTKDDKFSHKFLTTQFPEKDVQIVLLDQREFSIYLADRFSVNDSKDMISNDSSMDLGKLEGDAPVINLVNSIIMEALKRRVSDIHIEFFPSRIKVRFRIDGVLNLYRTIQAKYFQAVSSRIKIMANLNIMERRLPQDGRITVKQGTESVDLRVSCIPIAGSGESIVLRLLNRNDNRLTLDEMGFYEDQTSLFRRLARHPHGLILVTGPTGSGKTTTLSSLLEETNSEDKKIITIEDPIEYLIDGVDQIQTNTDIGLTFSSLLKRVLRQDPNVIMVGEIRDRETAELAIRAALTGHLVLSTLHTNDAVSAITRLRDMGVESFLLAAVLKGVMAQRLVRRLCPHCRGDRPVRPEETEVWRSAGLPPPVLIYYPQGCVNCGGVGFKGRIALGEIFQTDPELMELISQSAPSHELAAMIYKKGMKTLLNQGLRRVSEGITTLHEVEGTVYF